MPNVQLNVLSLTAVVCTRNRTQQLYRALISLKNQSSPASEILVIDNAPSDDLTRALVERDFRTVRYVHEPVPGLDFARNRALKESKGDIVAFLDDDAVAARDWCHVIRGVFATSGRAGACTGQVEPYTLDTEGQRLFEANGGFSRGNEPICLPRDVAKLLHGRTVPLVAWASSLGVGCNMALRRSVAIALGGFDECLDLGPALPGGGDIDMLWRLLKNEFEVIYEPKIRVWHEHRRELDAAIAQIIGHQRGLVVFLTKTIAHERGHARVSVLIYLLWRLFKPGVRLFHRLLGNDPLPMGVLARMWWNCWLGVPTYFLVRRIGRRRITAARLVL